jgi:hypothetical protein
MVLRAVCRRVSPAGIEHGGSPAAVLLSGLSDHVGMVAPPYDDRSWLYANRLWYDAHSRALSLATAQDVSQNPSQ